MSHFQIEITEKEDSNIIAFTGRINEEAELPDLTPYQNKPLIVDLNKVTFINSLGIRLWILWVEKHPEVSFSFMNIPPTILDQVNLIKDFLPKGSAILSFYVPTYCEECDIENNVLFKEGEDFTWSPEQKLVKEPLQLAPCKECNNEIELNIQPQKFFGFFKSYS